MCCAFINAIAEPTEIDDQHRTIVADHQRSLVRPLASLATQTKTRTPPWFADATDGAVASFGRDGRRLLRPWGATSAGCDRTSSPPRIDL